MMDNRDMWLFWTRAFGILAFCCLIWTTADPCEGSQHHLQKRSAESNVSCQCESKSMVMTCSDEQKDCLPDEIRFGGSCYSFLKGSRGRNEAHLDCIVRNSHLVYIESREEHEFIATFATHLLNGTPTRKDNFWIGIIPSLSFVWQDGSPLQSDVLDLPAGHGCFYISNGSFNLTVGNCEMNNRYICEMQTSTSRDCKGNSCYVISTESAVSTSQVDAQKICDVVYGGHLVTVDTGSEFVFIRGLLVKHIDEPGNYWIGLKSEYVWLDGARADYQAFSGKNNNGRGDLCFRLVPWSTPRFMWYDHRCSVELSYICEREMSFEAQQYIQDDVCTPPLANLIELFGSGPLCVRNGSDYFGNSILCQCGTEDCVRGCGCTRQVLKNGSSGFLCSCGNCDITYLIQTSQDLQSPRDEWQIIPTASLSCVCTDTTHDGGNHTVHYEFQDGTFRSLNANCEAVTTSSGVVTIVCVSIAVLIAVLITLACVIFATRKRCNKPVPSKSDLEPKPTTKSAHDFRVNAGLHEEPDDSDDGYADPGYEDPETAAPRQKPNTNQQFASRKPGSQSDSGLQIPPFKPKKEATNDEYADAVSRGQDSGVTRVFQPDKTRDTYHTILGNEEYSTLNGPSAVLQSAPTLPPLEDHGDNTDMKLAISVEDGYQSLSSRVGEQAQSAPARVPLEESNVYASLDPEGIESDK